MPASYRPAHLLWFELSTGLVFISLGVLLLGGARLRSDAFLADGTLSRYLAPANASLHVSCITKQDARVGAADFSDLMATTKARIAAGQGARFYPVMDQSPCSALPRTPP